VNFESYQNISFQRDNRVLTVTLDRPEKRNAINAEMHEELSRLFTDCSNDPESDVIILTGEGRAFCSGGDISWMQDMVDEPRRFDKCAREAKQIVFSILECEKPIIAKVNGHATGLGATIALLCDVIFASEKAKIGDPHVSVGFVAGDGGAVIWPQLIGYAKAKEYLMTGDLIRASDAEKLGLINHVHAPEALDEAVSAFAVRLSQGATNAIRWTKMSVNIGLKQLAHSIMDACISYEAQSNLTYDHQEAINAFREGRAPVFKGR